MLVLIAAFDFMGPLPPVVKHVGPRLDDVSWAGGWSPPPGEDPLVLVALSSDYQAQENVLQRIADALAALHVRGVITTGLIIAPETVRAAPNVQVVRSAPHAEVMRHASAVVTHRGHGTTLKALAAGLPLVCLPTVRDQMDIAARVVNAGAGRRLKASAKPKLIARTVLDVLSEPRYGRQAGRIAAAIARERETDLAVADRGARRRRRADGTGARVGHQRG